MYSKYGKSIEKLQALRSRAAATIRVRATEVLHKPGVEAFRSRAKELTATALIRAQQTTITSRQAAVGLAAAGVVTVGLVGGTMALADPAPQPASTTVASSADDAERRQLAADRADRSQRTAAPSSAPATSAAPKTGALVKSAPPVAKPTADKPVAAKSKPAAAKPTASKPTAPKPVAKKAAAPKPAAKKAAPWVNPMPGAPLSSCYGPRWGTMHQGIDFAGANGARIHTVGAGTVVAAGWNYTGYGISVVVDHGNGYLSHYAHAQKLLVSPGQYVKAGQALALEGSTGDSTGPHLHFEIHRGMWNQVEPAEWLRDRGVKMGC